MKRTATSSTSFPATKTVFDGWPLTPARARGAARTFMHGLEPAITADTADSVVLVVSELVTNAERHAGGACSLQLTAEPEAIEVAVMDPSSVPPRMRTPDLIDGTGGFGWPLVQHLARNVTVTHAADRGKKVTAQLPR